MQAYLVDGTDDRSMFLCEIWSQRMCTIFDLQTQYFIVFCRLMGTILPNCPIQLL